MLGSCLGARACHCSCMTSSCVPHAVCRSMCEKAAPCLLLLFPSPRACARCSVREVVVAGWLLGLVVGGVRGRSSLPRHSLTLNLNGLLLRCCLTVPLSTLSSKSDSFELSGSFRIRLKVISRKSLRFKQHNGWSRFTSYLWRWRLYPDKQEPGERLHVQRLAGARGQEAQV